MRQSPGFTLFTVAVLGLLSVTFLYSPGTGDVGLWRAWAENAHRAGVVAGYAANAADYPPGSTLLLAAVDRSAVAAGVDFFVGLKIALLIALLLSSWVVFGWTRDWRIAALFHGSLVLNSVALGYLDVFVILPLLATFWALDRQRYVLAAILFTTACLLKWQPLIIAPFLTVYLLRIGRFQDLRRLSDRSVVPFIVVPTLVLAACLAVFGAEVVQAFDRATSHTRFSAYAFNVPWIIQHALHVLSPDTFGPLTDGRSTILRITDLRFTLAPNVAFWTTYLALLGICVRREKSLKNLLLLSFLGYFAYVMFRPGVHENHLILASALAWALAGHAPRYRGYALATAAMTNVNLFLFYGHAGTGLGFSRVVAGLDMALVWAVLNLVLFGTMLVQVVREPLPGRSAPA